MPITEIPPVQLNDTKRRDSYRPPGRSVPPSAAGSSAGTAQKEDTALPTIAIPPPDPTPRVTAPVTPSLRFDVDEHTGKTSVSIVDPETGEVIREIPLEEALSLAKELEAQHGPIIDVKV